MQSENKTLPELLTDYAERVRKLATGQTIMVDLRDAPDAASAAIDAINAQAELNREVDEFVISSYQEMQVFETLGKAKLLFGVPV
ncbi:MAG TPA: hypothetical protein VD948_01520, partial [Rhodothermales bacterium]|nr:hypothetical protein [Rhodothermales bacterium]